jgi:response regulator of citrate/malate metabolism
MSVTHGNQKVTDEEIIDAIRSVKEPVASASDVAERCSLSQTAANNRLKELLAQDRVKKKSVGRGYVWWVSDLSES